MFDRVVVPTILLAFAAPAAAQNDAALRDRSKAAPRRVTMERPGLRRHHVRADAARAVHTGRPLRTF